MSHSLTDLVGPNVSADDFLAAVLATAAQPIWVVDPDGVIRFANPAAIAALGYDGVDELVGRDSHETIHYRRPDGTPYPAGECPMLLPRATGETVRSDLDWFFRRDGSMFPVSYVSAPIEMSEGRGAVVAFADIEDRLRSEQVLRDHEAVLAAREGALRRIASVVAGGAASPEVFAAIAREVAHLLGMALVVIWRYEPDRPATVVGAWGDRPHPFRAGSRWPVEERTVAALLPEIGRPSRIEDFGRVGGVIPDAIAETGIRSGTGSAIVVDGEIWGVMGAGIPEGTPLLDHIEDRLAEFTELVATTISNSAHREELARLADEQAALRRVAMLVAEVASPAAVFDAVAAETQRLLEAEFVTISRYEPDLEITAMAQRGPEARRMPPGTRLSHEGDSITATVWRTERAARMNYDEAGHGVIAEMARRRGIRVAVGAPIVVENRLWGVLIASWGGEEIPPADTEDRLAKFAQLLDTAIANADSRDQLSASRARLVTAEDESRRRVVRDLHDGAQQRLVHTIVMLKLTQRALHDNDSEAESLVGEALQQAQQATAELRELAHGILPAALTSGGLRAGVDAVVGRLDLPVRVEVPAERFPAEIEASAYFIVAEALTNVLKHAHAQQAEVRACVEDGRLHLEVRDDGIGRADVSGHGLVGLGDRVTALGGRLKIESPAGGGTLVDATLPL